MALDMDVLSKFVKVTNDKPAKKTESFVTGTAVEYDGRMFVRIDGSDRLTPVSSSASISDGNRVTVMIKNHEATVTGNTTDPSASSGTVGELDTKVEDASKQISEFEIIVADRVTAQDIEAVNGYFERIKAKLGQYTGLEAVTAEIETLQAKYANMEHITATDVEAINAEIEKIKGEFADFTQISAEDIDAIYGEFDNLKAYNADFTYVSAEKLQAIQADIVELNANKLSAVDADLKYANIDFSNIDQAAVTKIFSDSGIIKDLIVDEGKITGELVGVTIKGDIIEGGTVVADKLVVKGDNGLYYKLNTDGVTTEAEQTEYNSLSGSVITAKSITATKIAVEDLVAFGATIGGFHITDDAIYSGVKENVNNTTRGIYLDKTGQIAFGDSSNYMKYFYDEDAGVWKLDISASVIRLGSSNKTVEDYIDEKADEASASAAQEAATPVLRIDSSRGTVFKNNAVSTVLTVAIYKGGERITDVTGMKGAFGTTAYLQWYWQRLDEDRFGVLSADDPKISDDGFTLTLTPDDVDVKVTFMCELITS